MYKWMYTPLIFFSWRSHSQRICRFSEKNKWNSCKEMELSIFPNDRMGPYSKLIINHPCGFLTFTRNAEENKKSSFWLWCSFNIYLSFNIAFLNFILFLYTVFLLNKYLRYININSQSTLKKYYLIWIRNVFMSLFQFWTLFVLKLNLDFNHVKCSLLFHWCSYNLLNTFLHFCFIYCSLLIPSNTYYKLLMDETEGMFCFSGCIRRCFKLNCLVGCIL